MTTLPGIISPPCCAALLLADAFPFLQALGLTLRLSLAASALLLVFGIPLAHWLNTSRLRGISLVQTLVSLPVVLPPTVIGFYLLVAFAPTHFPGSLWVRLTGHPLSFSFTGLLVGSVLYSLPYAVQAVPGGAGRGAARSAGGRRRVGRAAVARVLARAAAAGRAGDCWSAWR